MSKFSKKFMSRHPFAKSATSTFKQYTPEHGVELTQRGATNEEVRKQEEEERIGQRVQDLETNIEISEDASEREGMSGTSISKARDWTENKSYEDLSQDQINKLAKTGDNPATPAHIRKQIQGFLDSGKNPGEGTKEAPVDAFTRSYFKEQGIENPTEADYRVAERMYSKSK